MANKPQVTLTIGGDSTGIERAFDKVGAGAKELGGDLERAEGDAKSFGRAIDNAAERTDASERTFMGTADVLDGLAAAFGLPIDRAVELGRAGGDLAGGFTNLAPAIKGFGGSLSALATGPMGLMIAAGAALAGGIVLLWQHSETFRDIVTGAFEAVKGVVGPIIEGIGKAVGWLGGVFGGSGDDAEKLAEEHEEAGQRLAAAYEEATQKVTSVLDAMADPFERFNHGQELTLEQATENLRNNVSEYQKWAEDIRVIRERFGEDTAQFVIGQGEKFHGVADQLANSTDAMGGEFERIISQLGMIEDRTGQTASSWEEDWGKIANAALRVPDMLGDMFDFTSPAAARKGTEQYMRGGSGGGNANVYNINVHAWDTRDGGVQVVNAIRNYESKNGTSWRAR